MKKKDYILLAGILLIHLIFLVVLKFTAWPEMSLWPYLITKGWLPYKDIAIAHTPLMLFALGIIYKIFGVGILQLKLFTWLMILFFDGLIFAVVKKIWNIKTAFLSLVFYSLWLLFYDGNGLWFDLYMGLLAFCSFYFARQKKWFWTGIFWALALISKQTAIWFLLPISWAMVDGQWLMIKKNIGKFIFGGISVMLIFLIGIWFLGILPDFWNWAVKFGVFILPRAQGQIQLPNLKTLGAAVFPFLIFIPLILKTGKKNVNLLLWAVAGALGAYPRFELFHLQPAIPYLAIATAMVLSEVRNEKNIFRFFIFIYVVTSIYLLGGFFMRNYKEGVRFYEQNVADVVTYVKYNTNAGDRIFVLNWWDNIYAYSDTLPAVDPWIPQLSWYMEIPGVQEKMIEGLSTNPPKLIIYYPYTNIGLSSYIPKEVYNYVTENYHVSQKVDNLEILIPNNH